MEFQRLLLHIGQSLGAEDVKALAFLCTDLSLRSLNSVELFSDLCSSLSDQDLLSSEQPQLLEELLLTIQRPRLVRDLNLTDQGPRRDLISSYRKLLYNISEDITDEDLRSIKFLLNQQLPRRRLDENVTTLELFLEMEHMDLLGENNLDLLQSIIESVCPVLNGKINRFKEQKAAYANPACEEPTTVSYPDTQNQCTSYENPQPLVGGSTESYAVRGSQPFAQPFFNSFNASVDFPRGVSKNNDTLSQQVSDINIGTKGSLVKGACDTLKISVESTSISEKQATTLHFYTAAINDEVLGAYPMTGAKRGFCLIINNNNFTISDLKKREGTNVDKDCLERVFEWLGFEVEVHDDCTREDMLSVVTELSSRKHFDCMVCCILSHGVEGAIYGVNGLTVRIKDLTEPFNGSKCPSLANKPKLFFIQACQGTLEQKAVYTEADGPTPCSVESDAVKPEESIPSDADFLLGMATVPSYASYRERSSGTWFIQALCKNLIELVPSPSLGLYSNIESESVGCLTIQRLKGYYCKVDLISILTKVNADVSQKTDLYGIKKQMPQPAFSLRKKVIFPVPPTPPPSLLPK